MLTFTLEDGTSMTISETATILTNKGPLQASEVLVGYYVRCGNLKFCRVDSIA